MGDVPMVPLGNGTGTVLGMGWSTGGSESYKANIDDSGASIKHMPCPPTTLQRKSAAWLYSPNLLFYMALPRGIEPLFSP